MTEGGTAIVRASTDHLRLLEVYVDLYKHHLDWFLKASVVYLAFAGTAAGIAFKSETTEFIQTLLLAVVAVISIFATASWIAGWRWLTGLERHLQKTATEAHLEPISLSAAKAAIISTTLGSTTVLLGSIAILITKIR